jgi:signal recognition particle subunit SRP19
MPPQTTIDEEFDDDTDLPLPSQPLPHTGSHGPILEAISSDEDDLPTLGQPSVSSQSTSATQPLGRARDTDGSSNHHAVTDITPYKKYVFLLVFCAANHSHSV